MTQSIGVQGIGLAPPSSLTPTQANGQPSLVGSNALSLAGGQAALIPPGLFYIDPGKTSLVQVKDPVTGTWRAINPVQALQIIESDGVNFRVYNPTGFPVGAVMTNAGTGYTSAPTVAATPAGASFTAVVGGGVSAVNLTSSATASVTTAGGVGYNYPPLVNIDKPPAGGVPATAVCSISGGVIRTVTMLNNGAGYTSAPPVVIAPHPLDTSGPTFTATAVAQLSYVGQVTAVLCTDPGDEVYTAAPALTFSGGGGSSAAATAVMAFGVTSITPTGGSGFGAAGTRIGVSSFGGYLETFTSGKTPVAAAQNPAISTGLFQPRPVDGVTTAATAGLNVVTGASGIYNAGLAQTVPDIFFQPNGGAAPTLAVVVGAVNDTVFITPAVTQ
jgi:hypothetical protein